MNYNFAGGSQRPQASSELLAEGDYTFEVLECREPYRKDNGRWVMKVKLSIQPGDQWVWADPWSGETEAGEKRDGIGDFLLCVNRAPVLGREPDWDKVVGAKGRCRLKVEDAAAGSRAGQQRNVVNFFHRPKQIGPTADRPSVSRNEFEKARAQSAKKAGITEDQAPDDIPF